MGARAVPPAKGFARPIHCDETTPAKVEIPPGSIVTDLGDTILVGMMPKGAWLMRKVRFEGQAVWVLDLNPKAVDNPHGGTSAGADQCLEPVKR